MDPSIDSPSLRPSQKPANPPIDTARQYQAEVMGGKGL
jgi:hypothetical protein